MDTTRPDGSMRADRREGVELSRRDLLPAALLGAGAMGLLAGAARAGPLNPPAGPVASGGRTLQEIYDKITPGDPRTPVNATTCPGDANAQFIIATPGSYYMTASHTVSGKVVVRITASDVVLDLNGFTLHVSTNSAPAVDCGPVTMVTVRNGVLRGLGGVNLTNAALAVVERLVVFGSSGTSIGAGRATVSDCRVTLASTTGACVSVGSESLVQRCVCSGGGTGVATGSGSMIADCEATSAQATSAGGGFFLGNGGAIIRCVARQCGNGILAGENCTVEGCNATGCTTGISVGQFCRVIGCNTAGSISAGIAATNSSDIRECTCSGDSALATGLAAINVTGSGSRIERNTTIGGRRGIRCTATGNMIASNFCRGATGTGSPSANYDIVAGNDVGPLTSASGAISAWANITF